jgi:ferredoxin
MRVSVDHNVCIGYGNCTLALPEVFEFDESANTSVPTSDHIPADLTSAVKEVVADCPTQAISLSAD